VSQERVRQTALARCGLLRGHVTSAKFEAVPDKRSWRLTPSRRQRERLGSIAGQKYRTRSRHLVCESLRSKWSLFVALEGAISLHRFANSRYLKQTLAGAPLSALHSQGLPRTTGPRKRPLTGIRDLMSFRTATGSRQVNALRHPELQAIVLPCTTSLQPPGSSSAASTSESSESENARSHDSDVFWEIAIGSFLPSIRLQFIMTR
jgi:hypothetical protein